MSRKRQIFFRMMTKRILLFFLLILPVLALQSQVRHRLTFTECLHLAGEHSFTVQAEQSKTVALEQRAGLVKTQAIPKISGDLGGEGRFLNGYNFGQEWALVQADWSLGHFFQKTDRAARQDVKTQKYRVRQKQMEAMGNAAVLYVAVLQVRKALQLLTVRLQLMRKHQLLAASMWKAGLRTQLDVLQTQTQISKFREDSVKLVMQMVNLRNTLARRLGWKSGDSLQVIPFRMQTLEQLPLPELNPQVISGNMKVKILQSQVTAEKLRTENVKAARYPHFTLGGGWFADADPTGDGNYWLVNAGIRIPIYEGKAVKIRETAMLAQKESLQFQLQNARRETAIKLNKLKEKMNRLREMMKIQQQRIQTLKQSSDFAEVNFKAGLITNLEYLDIQHNLTDARLKLEQSRLIFAMSLIDYYVVANQPERLMALGK
jgi:outer membrane protein TolC